MLCNKFIYITILLTLIFINEREEGKLMKMFNDTLNTFYLRLYVIGHFFMQHN